MNRLRVPFVIHWAGTPNPDLSGLIEPVRVPFQFVPKIDRPSEPSMSKTAREMEFEAPSLSQQEATELSSGRYREAANQPPPTRPDGSPAPPPTSLAPGRTGEPNSWVPIPGSKSRDTRWKPREPIRIKNGSQPSASWDPEHGHWVVDNGQGQRDRYLPDGTRVDHDNEPLPFLVPTPLAPVPATPGISLPALPGLRIPIPFLP